MKWKQVCSFVTSQLFCFTSTVDVYGGQYLTVNTELKCLLWRLCLDFTVLLHDFHLFSVMEGCRCGSSRRTSTLRCAGLLPPMMLSTDALNDGSYRAARHLNQVSSFWLLPFQNGRGIAEQSGNNITHYVAHCGDMLVQRLWCGGTSKLIKLWSHSSRWCLCYLSPWQM